MTSWGVPARDGFDVRLEWGERGIETAAVGAAVTIVVDVLSFSTAVDLAVSRGGIVVPWPWRDASAVEEAKRLGAALAVSRTEVSNEQPFSLSPPTLAGIEAGTLIVLPSPNGATLSVQARERSQFVMAGCLRNASAVARAALRLAAGRPIAVIPAGERWPEDDSLRPAIEDLLGAGAIVAGLAAGGLTPSPEAQVAAAAFEATSDLGEAIAESVSGRELRDIGFGRDVTYATALDASDAAPLLQDGAYAQAPG